MVDSEKPHSKFEHLYAIIRFDIPVDVDDPENSIAVVKVLSTRQAAEKEVARLNHINREKACRYVLYTTRLAI
jgi:hypothetical protein